MDFNEYQKKAIETAGYPTIGEKFVYPALGLAGESGEVLEKIKKIFRNEGGMITDECRLSIKKELGDVLWYLAMLSHEFGFSFEEVAQLNLEKLTSRLERGVVNSDGDDR
jgi:NTP pyrophosphatase (non-canonical NTP hydrolase)